MPAVRSSFDFSSCPNLARQLYNLRHSLILKAAAVMFVLADVSCRVVGHRVGLQTQQ
jgi:hypothetical protein